MSSCVGGSAPEKTVLRESGMQQGLCAARNVLCGDIVIRKLASLNDAGITHTLQGGIIRLSTAMMI